MTSGIFNGKPRGALYITISYRIIENTQPYIINVVHDGKVQWNTDGYTTNFLHSNWLYFLWQGLKKYIKDVSPLQSLDNVIVVIE